jgi:ATP-dependent DNA ligase
LDQRESFPRDIHRADAPATHGKLPEGADWLYELKLDGYRCVAFKTGGKSPCPLAQ